MTAVSPSRGVAGRLPSNPFSTRFTRPGMVPPLDASGRPLDVVLLAERIHSQGGMFVIEGPHGHGKTTLLVAILAVLRGRGRTTLLVRADSFAAAWGVVLDIAQARAGTVVGVDGWEQLPPGATAAIRMISRWRRTVIGVTAHRWTGLPVLSRCHTSPDVLAGVVERLPGHGGRIGRTDILEAFHRHGGNVREALYDLYDRFERRVRRS